MTVKTDISRFDIHDELTAPDESARLLAGMASAGGSVSKFVGVLAGSPAALRAFARMRHELRGGALPRRTRERIALAVAEEPRRHLLGRPARQDRPRRGARPRRDLAGPGLDLERSPGGGAARLPEGRCSTDEGRPATHLLEEAREVDWSDEQLLEAVAHVALNEFQSLMANAAALPQDQSDPSSCRLPRSPDDR